MPYSGKPTNETFCRPREWPGRSVNPKMADVNASSGSNRFIPQNGTPLSRITGIIAYGSANRLDVTARTPQGVTQRIDDPTTDPGRR